MKKKITEEHLKGIAGYLDYNLDTGKAVEVKLSHGTPGAFIVNRPDGTTLKGTGDYASLAFAIELLKELEWVMDWESQINVCPMCGGQEPVGRWKDKYGHEPDCKLHLFLKRFV